MTKEEGYPGLVVPGPLIGAWLAEMVRLNTDRPVKTLAFQARNPIFDITPFRVEAVPEGDNVDLQAVRCDGAVAMTMQIGLG